MVYILLGVLLVTACCVFIMKRHQKKEAETVYTEDIYEKSPRQAIRTQPIVRTYVPGPKLTRDDGVFYAVVQAAIAQTLAAEGIDPEKGFVIRAIKPVRDADQNPLSLKENEALYAVIMSAVAQTLSAEGINPEGGFAIRSIAHVSV